MRGDNLERELGNSGNEIRRRTQLVERERSWNLQASKNSSVRKYLYKTLTGPSCKDIQESTAIQHDTWVGFWPQCSSCCYARDRNESQTRAFLIAFHVCFFTDSPNLWSFQADEPHAVIT